MCAEHAYFELCFLRFRRSLLCIVDASIQASMLPRIDTPPRSCHALRAVSVGVTRWVSEHGHPNFDQWASSQVRASAPLAGRITAQPRPLLAQVVVLFWAPSCPDSRVQIPRVVKELEAGGAMLRLPRLLPHAPHVEDTLRAGFPMTRVVGYVEDDDTPDSAISGFMNERLLRFPARAHPPHSPHSVSATGPQRSHVQVGRAKNDGRKAPYIRLVSAYRGVPWVLLVDGATCTPTWSNGGFALNRFVPECSRHAGRSPSCSAQRSRWHCSWRLSRPVPPFALVARIPFGRVRSATCPHSS
jgi:hypothetical protein